MSGSQRIITDTDKAPLVQVLTLMFLVIAILACFVRSVTKLYMVKTLKLDDILVVISTALASVQSGVVFVSCDDGLGKTFDSLSRENVDAFFKTQYTANAMFIASMLCSRLAATMGLHLLRRPSQKLLILVFEIAVGVWGISALLVSLLQCKVPSPWDYSDSSRCIDRNAFWIYYAVANIVIDILAIVIVADNVRQIKTTWAKKTLVISVFGSRILVVPAAIAQLYYSGKASSRDPSFSVWEATISMQLMQFLAILTVCIPNLKPFLDSLESGQIRVDDLRRQGKSHSDGYPTYNLGPSGHKSGQSSAVDSRSRRHNTSDMLTSAASKHSYVHELVEFPRATVQTTRVATGQQKKSFDEVSHKSHTSQTILIRQTWEVNVQDAPTSQGSH